MTPDSTETTPPVRSKSSRAQTVTAWATATLAVTLLGLILFGGALLVAGGNAFDRMITSTASPSAVGQWLCLPYTQFVLEQHRAGLTPNQIAATLEVSEYNRRGQQGLIAPVADITEPRLDSMDACGLPSEIIDATTPVATP